MHFAFDASHRSLDLISDGLRSGSSEVDGEVLGSPDCAQLEVSGVVPEHGARRVDAAWRVLRQAWFWGGTAKMWPMG